MTDPTAEWNDFRTRHGPWLTRNAAATPIYALPERAIAELSKSGRVRLPPFRDEASVRAERDFTTLCLRNHAVGFLDSRPINYPFLDLIPTLPAPSRALMDECGWTYSQQAAIREMVDQLSSVRLRCKGVAGWLVVEPSFQAEVEALAAQWTALPSSEQPAFPLRRPPPFPFPSISSAKVSEETSAFVAAFVAFCDRWDLTGLASWDLPEPLGPLLPDLSSPDDPATAGRALRLSLPLHYPLLSDDDLLSKVFEQQRQLARERGLDPSLAGLPHHKAYGQIFEVVHLEQTVLGRFDRPGRHKGLIAEVLRMAAVVLGLAEARIRTLRKAASACRRGRRADVAWLRPRIR